MADIIAGTIVTILAVVGFVAFIKGIINIVFRPRYVKTTIIIDVSGLDCNHIEYTIRSLVQKIRYSYNQSMTQLLISGNHLDKESAKICENLCREYEFVKIIKENDGKDFLSKYSV